ncbi:MAG: hypothetical protein MR606_01745 [Mollicutes bacterium]|nr:hypothetical protein [Mollicutes bacterium]MDD7263403.1 hypothetical protein [bacterium]MDY4980017.1 hypothetical protein [Candidatus Onthovivens sp.]
MYTLEDMFNDCRNLYKASYDVVKNMSCSVGACLEKANVAFDPRITCMKFDIVFQYSLLQIATKDFFLNKDEVIFIRDLTESDILDIINASENTDYTWEEIYNLPITTIRKILSDVESPMETLGQEVVNIFSLCDKITEYDYVSDLEKNVRLIISALSLIDGNTDNSKSSQNCLILKLIKKIKKEKNKID